MISYLLRFLLRFLSRLPTLLALLVAIFFANLPLCQRANASPNVVERVESGRQRSENYCRGTIREAGYNPQHPSLLLVDKASFCTYILQRSDEGLVSVFSTPNSLGRPGHETKAGFYRIDKLVLWPIWSDPETGARIQPYDQDKGNPLGVAAITIRADLNQTSKRPLSLTELPLLNMALHGTNREDLIGGLEVSGGCMRHFNFGITTIVSVMRKGDSLVIVDNLSSISGLSPSLFQRLY